MSHLLLTLGVALVAAALAHRFAGGPGLPSAAYVLPAALQQDRPRPWWQLGLQLTSTFGRRWVRTRVGRRRAVAQDVLATAGRADGTLLLPGLRDADHAAAATRAALLALAATVGTLGLEPGTAWQVPPVTALAAAVLGLVTVRPGVVLPALAGLVLLPLAGAAAAVAVSVAGAVAVAGTLRRRRVLWVRIGTVLAVGLVAEAAWRLTG